MKLLIVDDEIIIRTGLSTFIPWADNGYELLEPAASAEEAIARLESEQPNIILTDIQMTGLTGLDLAREVRRLLPESEVIILSGYDQYKYSEKASREGVSEYLLKTSRPDEIMKAVGGARQRIIMRGESLKRNHLRDERMEDLLSGKTWDDSMLLQAKVLLPKLMLHEPNSYFVFKIGASGWGEEKSIQKLLIFAVHNVISELLKCEAMLSRENIILIVRQSYASSPLQIESELERIELKLKCRIYAGAGQLASSFEQMKHSYNTASYSYLFHDLLPQQKVITFEEVQKRMGGRTECSQEEKEQLAALLEQGNESVMRIWVENVFERQRTDAETTPQSLQAYVHAVLSTASDIIQRSNDDISKEQSERIDRVRPNSEDVIPLELVATRGHEWLQERLLELVTTNQYKSDESNIPHINRAISYIHEYLNRNVSLQDVAEYVQLSTNHFSEVFHRETGLEYSEYLLQVRMKRAKQLLEVRDVTVNEIAAMVGFLDVDVFAKQFEQTVGLHPEQVQKKI